MVVLVALAAAALIVAPLLRKDAAEAERLSAANSEEVELRLQHNMVLGALKDLEDDRATHKIVEEDYAEMQAELTSQAVELMKKLDAMDEEHRKLMASRTIQHPSAKSSETST